MHYYRMLIVLHVYHYLPNVITVLLNDDANVSDTSENVTEVNDYSEVNDQIKTSWDSRLSPASSTINQFSGSKQLLKVSLERTASYKDR